jgi:DNA-binding transcriptional regulator YiaG
LARGAAAIAASHHWCGPAAPGTSVAQFAGMADNTPNLIRQLRQQLGMTQEEFAHEIAVTVSTVNRWENSHAEPSKLAWKAIRDLAGKRGVRADGPSNLEY